MSFGLIVAGILVFQTSPMGVELLLKTFSSVPINLRMHGYWPHEGRYS